VTFSGALIKQHIQAIRHYTTLYNVIQNYTTIYKVIRHYTTLYNVIQDYQNDETIQECT
jgi:hypothetical protein